MLTTIGDKILEIRPKQVIESDVIISNDYLVLIETKKTKLPKPIKTKVEKNNEPTKYTS